MAWARLAGVAMALMALSGAAHADATIPTKDIAGVKDNPMLKRYEGSFIVSGASSAFTDFKVPLSKLEQTDRRDPMNNILFVPKQEQEVEGAFTRLVYVAPANRSPLEVLRNYQDEIEAAGGAVLFGCKTEGCGGDHTRASSGGGGESSLMMYFFREADIKDGSFSNGACAVTGTISDQRFFAAKLPRPGGEAHVTVQTYQLGDNGYCTALTGRTVAVVHIVEPRSREKKMTEVKAQEMARSLGSTGRIALYGILFDTNKTEIKPESAATLQEIAALMKSDAKLAVIVVGHTDNQGGYDYNVDLSRRRADAVIKALAADYKLDAKRFRAAGVGMVAPVASNDAEEGRSQNRRVELVKLN
ncbi:outer membrane protein OmpA-like peptidoglycan-associated protein [Bosea sp. BE125]|uniref:OmpA family protein n=1 Tax=Bosea sp. BE125 TaxID=2817909 RepID=UPI002855CC49|nr:OmpA family protein [Bosea sp. BE125]MDR6870465.1 outer membrane protein OmpA-like peptidoglycan-associated protein [Bosea sp. BE125]